MKCQACKEQEVAWAWQPFGPDEKPDCYTLLGSHYRGFPVIKVCDTCKSAFKTGDFPVTFAYKGHQFVGKEHEVREVGASLWLGESHRTSELNSDVLVRAIMRDTLKGIDVAALVYEDNSDLLLAFLSAPALVEACGVPVYRTTGVPKAVPRVGRGGVMEYPIYPYSRDRSVISLLRNGHAVCFTRQEALAHARFTIGIRGSCVLPDGTWELTRLSGVYVEGDEDAGVIMAIELPLERVARDGTCWQCGLHRLTSLLSPVPRPVLARKEEVEYAS